MAIRIGIAGYGNLAKAIVKIVDNYNDLKVRLILTRRNVNEIKLLNDNIIVDNLSNMTKYVDDIDVMIVCMGSSVDLPIHIGEIAAYFNTVDTYDNHNNIDKYIETIQNKVSINHTKTAVICSGWDPGLFSIIRALFASLIPANQQFTLWGKGVSQGHSQAIRSIDGVIDAVAYTIPNQELVNQLLFNSIKLPKQDLHKLHSRQCYIVVKENSDKQSIRQKIVSMPDYFAPYQVMVEFIDLQQLQEQHSKLFHAGKVLTHLDLDSENYTAQFAVQMSSNPLFTASIALAFSRAAYRLNNKQLYGVFTPLDIPLKYLLEDSNDISLI